MRKRKPNTLPLKQRFALTPSNSAAALDCSLSKLYDLRKKGFVEFVDIDGLARVTARSLRKLVGEPEQTEI